MLGKFAESAFGEKLSITRKNYLLKKFIVTSIVAAFALLTPALAHTNRVPCLALCSTPSVTRCIRKRRGEWEKCLFISFVNIMRELPQLIGKRFEPEVKLMRHK